MFCNVLQKKLYSTKQTTAFNDLQLEFFIYTDRMPFIHILSQVRSKPLLLNMQCKTKQYILLLSVISDVTSNDH